MQAPPPLPTAPPVTDDDRTLAMLCHLSGLFTGFVGPLVIWLVKKDSSPFIDHHGREALNFHITLMLAMMVLGGITFLLMFVFVGVLLIPVLLAIPVLAMVVEILACVSASKGEWYRYPCCLRLV